MKKFDYSSGFQWRVRRRILRPSRNVFGAHFFPFFFFFVPQYVYRNLTAKNTIESDNFKRTTPGGPAEKFARFRRRSGFRRNPKGQKNK